jgi:integrase
MATKDTLRLNDRDIRLWIKNDVRFDARADGNGLYIRYRSNDSKPVFYFRFTLAGVGNKIMLGKFPEKSLAAARKECIGYHATIHQGLNPAAIKREQKLETAAQAIAEKSASTVSELVDDFFKRNIDDKCITAIQIRQRVDNHIIPAIGAMKIEAVKPMHISNMLDMIDAPSASNKVLSITKRLFNHAIKRHTIDSNPAAAFDISDAGGTMTGRSRFLSESDIIELFKAMSAAKNFTRHHYLTTKLLLLLGCRKNELFKAKRTEFDLVNAEWTMSVDNKTKSAITVPLSATALETITELMQYGIDGSEYLLPSMGSRLSKLGYVCKNYLCIPTQKYVYPLMAGVEPFVLHDLRRTMRTHLGKLGVNRFVAERCLNHKIPGMEGVYDAGDYLPERRAALDKWAMFLESCEAGKVWNVTPIKKAL